MEKDSPTTLETILPIVCESFANKGDEEGGGRGNQNGNDCSK